MTVCTPWTRRVQVRADVGDHHVHVRAGEAADELGQREGHQDGAKGTRRVTRTNRLSHATQYGTTDGPAGVAPRQTPLIHVDVMMTKPDGRFRVACLR